MSKKEAYESIKNEISAINSQKGVTHLCKIGQLLNLKDFCDKEISDNVKDLLLKIDADLYNLGG